MTGPWLSELVLARGPLALREVLALVAEVAARLEDAHARRLYHPDLRPEVIRCDGPRVTIEGWDRPRPFALHADRVDVEAAAVVALFALTGDRAARAAADLARRADVPAGLAALLRQMLARAPIDRPTALEVRLEAERLAAPARRFRWVATG